MLEAVVARTPRPGGDPDGAARARSSSTREYDQYRGVVAYVRVVDGRFARARSCR